MGTPLHHGKGVQWRSLTCKLLEVQEADPQGSAYVGAEQRAVPAMLQELGQQQMLVTRQGAQLRSAGVWGSPPLLAP